MFFWRISFKVSEEIQWQRFSVRTVFCGINRFRTSKMALVRLEQASLTVFDFNTKLVRFFCNNSLLTKAQSTFFKSQIFRLSGGSLFGYPAKIVVIELWSEFAIGGITFVDK